ncbi:MAG: heterodisulfide reductase-related iron-sulfur binding cluster [Candidatus Nezhaarchaeota archaeon]|nr:heterodisulfide reductase-related iron-sulfur binding cluster [Candidatus Nezhaarchaeota archaeon]
MVKALSARVLAWIGCMSSYRTPELARSLISILKALNVDHVMLGKDELCCGSILLRLGLRSEALEVAQRTLDELARVQASTLVTHCPGCLRTFKLDYPELFDFKLSLEMVHSTQLILRCLDSKELSPVKIKAAYLDPCHLGRHLKVYDEPRKLLSLIPGLTIIEPPEKREASLCCGAGGGVKSCLEELSLTVAKELIEYFRLLGAEAVVTACPFCYYNLNEASRGALRIVDILQVVDASLRGVPVEKLG